GGGTLVSPQGNDSMTINWGAVAATYPVRVDAARLCGSPDFQTLNVQVRTTIQSAAGCSTNCNWVNTASWIGGVIPTANDYAEIQAGHTVIINQSTAVCRKLTINGSARWNAARTLTVGDKGIVVNTTGDIAGAGAGTCISQGGFTGINNANITSSTVTIVLQTNNANITSYGSLNRLQVTGITVTNTDTITIANGGSLTGTGTLAQSSNSSFVMQGTTFSVTGFDASATGNNVYYSANANQTVRSGTYEYLTLSGTSTKTLGGITIVNKDIKITGVTLDASTTNYALTVTGNWTNTGTYNPRFNTTTFNGGGTQTITNASGETFNNLNMSGAGTKILAGNVTINFDFTLNAPVNIGDNDMNIKGNFDNSSTYTASSNNDVTFSNSSIVTGSSPTQFINIIVTGALTGHASNMNVSGNWANNGTFNHNNGTVTFNGTTTVSGSSTTSFKNVTISGTLTGHSSTMNVAGNWTNNGTYNHNNGTLGFTGTSAQTIGGSVASETWRNLTINNSAGVALGHTGSLLGTLTLTDGAFNVSGQNFTIVSNGSGTGRIGPIPGAGTITGNFTMQRYVSGADGWRMLASPVSGTDIEGWDDNFITTGVPGSDYPAFSWVSLYRYDESQLGDQNSGWTYVSSTSDPMNPGTGIFAFISDVLGNPITTTLDQTGSLTSGTQAISVTYTDDPGQPDSEDGWNLVGNPYPSDIDWSLVSRSATVTPFAYVWNENTSSYVTYDANDPAGSNSIASHQAFWVKTSGGNGTVTIDEPDKSTELDPYYKVGVPTLLDLSLTIKKNAFVSTSRIRTRENGTPAYETEYDALLARSITPGAPNIFSLSSDSVELVVNSIPDTFNNISIPVQIDSGSPGNYSILIKKNALPPATCAILETVPDGIFYDLLITDSFTINVQTNTTQTRIILHLGAPFAKQTVNPTCNGFADGMAIISPQGSGPWDYVWKDSGENVIKTTSGSMIPDTLSGLPSGVFYGEVTSANTSCNKNYDAFIIQDPPMSIEAVADVIPPTCFENSDGMIDLMVTGSAPPFAYLWSDGATSEDRNGLPAGTFTVIVRDADNCPANGTFNIVPPEQVVAAFAISDDTVYINQGGTSSFINTSTGGDIFTWDFGDGSIVDSAVNTEHTFSDTGIYLVSLNVSNDACEDMVIIPLLVLQDKPGSIQSYIPSAEG
ncbi:MAG: PKD domain-containing protein, partial [Bacteroidetes bacterium]|nr:PKD domain-containing protein [Bacteroidota bacterium]